jgi:hypothetical protein
MGVQIQSMTHTQQGIGKIPIGSQAGKTLAIACVSGGELIIQIGDAHTSEQIEAASLSTRPEADGRIQK